MNKKSEIFLVLFLSLLQINLTLSANSGIVSYSNSPKEESLQDFSFDFNWESFDKHPRLLGDIDGDGKDDIIGFKDKTYVSFGKDTPPYFENPVVLSESFGFGSIDFDYTTFNKYPRMIADVDGDGKDDVIGFEEDGVFVAFSNGRANLETKILVCAHFTPTQGGYASYDKFPRFFGDIDGDGMADLISVQGAGIAIIKSQGRDLLSGQDRISHFNSAAGYLSQNEHPRLVADIDGDGRVDVVGFAEDKIEVVFSKESGFEGPITISENELVKGNSWSSFDLFPRFLKDYNEDGKADILAISSSAVITKLSKGTETLDTSNIYLISKFGYTDSTGLYSTFDKSPRQIGDINGDGALDIVGFGEGGIQVSLGVKSCSHPTRDPMEQCSCKPGFYDAGDGLECLSCEYPCDNCTTSTDCLSCSTDENRLNTTTCKCSLGYYDNNTICQICPEKYGSCIDESTPLSCKGNFRKELIDDCKCMEGYYEDPDSDNCIECNYSRCVTCNNGPNDCGIFCPVNCGYCNLDASCLQCKIGYYLNQAGECEICHQKCLSCQDSSENCTVCQENGVGRSKNVNFEDKCQCLDGFYQNGTILDCVKCENVNCKTCDFSGQCLECLNEGSFPPLCESQIPVRNGHFVEIKKDENNKEVIIEGKCDIKCQQCDQTPQNCTQCIKGLFRENRLSCNCLEGYHDNLGTTKNCQKCPILCQKCLSEDYCLQCNENQFSRLDTFSRKCVCIHGYKENQNGECQRCYQYNNQCFFQCPYNSFINEGRYSCETYQFTQIGDFRTLFLFGSLIVLLIICLKYMTLSRVMYYAKRTQNMKKSRGNLNQKEQNKAIKNNQ